MFGKKVPAKKSETSTGVDVGSFAVKIVQMSRKGEGFYLDGFGYAPINPNRSDGVAEAIRQACMDAKITYRKVCSSVPAEGSIVRYLVMPEMSSEDLSRAMEFEIDRYVPFSKEEVVSDYMVLQERPDRKNMKVLLVAARRESIDNRVKVLKDATLEPEVITIDSIVLRNTFQVNYPEKSSKTVGLLNIGAKTSNINIIRGSVSYFIRDLQLGGDSITQILKEKLNISPEEAEQLKRDLRVDDKEKFKIIEPVLGNLLNEIYLSFDYYESEFGMVVDEVVVSGGTARLAFLFDFLKENLNRGIALLNPVNNIEISPTVSKERLGELSPSLAVSLGLAFENFA